jgi:hypothetical protein
MSQVWRRTVALGRRGCVGADKQAKHLGQILAHRWIAEQLHDLRRFEDRDAFATRIPLQHEGLAFEVATDAATRCGESGHRALGDSRWLTSKESLEAGITESDAWPDGKIATI